MADIAKFVEEIKSMTVLELNELVKAIEEEFGVSAAAPVMVAGAGAAAPAAEEKTELRWKKPDESSRCTVFCNLAESGDDNFKKL